MVKEFTAYLIEPPQLFELLEGALKLRNSHFDWAFYPNPEKAEGSLFGWCKKARGKDYYSYSITGHLKVKDDPDYTLVTNASRGYGSYQLSLEDGKKLQKLIKKAKQVANVSEVWPEHYCG